MLYQIEGYTDHLVGTIQSQCEFFYVTCNDISVIYQSQCDYFQTLSIVKWRRKTNRRQTWFILFHDCDRCRRDRSTIQSGTVLSPHADVVHGGHGRLVGQLQGETRHVV